MPPAAISNKKPAMRMSAAPAPHHHRAVVHRRNHQRDIGMLMLLLAAETVVSVAQPQQVMATEMLAAAMQLGYNSPAGTSSSFTSGTKLPVSHTPQRVAESLGGETESSDESEVPEDHATTPTVNGASFSWMIGEVPATSTPKKTHETASANSSLLDRSIMHLSDSAATTRTSSRGAEQAAKSTSTTQASIVLSSNNVIISTVVSFLSWRDVVSIRGVSKQWLQASLNVVSVCRMPMSGVPALFIPYPAAAEAPATNSYPTNNYRSHHNNGHHSGYHTHANPEPLYWSSQTTAWMCPNCCTMNSPARASCPRYGCGAMSPSTWDSKRLFFGQLRRDSTIPFVLWVLRDVVGISDKEIRSIENHRDKITGRGKGCAWVTVSTHPASTTSSSTSLSTATSAADKLLSLHHRAFFDTIHGVEGLWLTIPKTTEDLDREASMRVSNNTTDGFKGKHHETSSSASVSSHPSLPQHHPRHMPRSSVVVEATNPTQTSMAVNNFLGRSRNFPIHYIRGDNGKIRYVHNPYFQSSPMPAVSAPSPVSISSPADVTGEAL